MRVLRMALVAFFCKRRYFAGMEWVVEPGLTEYPAALAAMDARVRAIQAGKAPERVWLVEHPPLYTLGTSAKAGDVLGTGPIPTYATGRGGQVTYHGPGQRVGYVMRDLKRHAGAAGPDLRAYVAALEQWIILSLARFGVAGMVREGRVGVWVETPQGEAKIAALGVRIQKWVTSHGVALNVHPDLSHYAGIVPCGIREYGVTSLSALGVAVSMADVDAVLREEFTRVFG